MLSKEKREAIKSFIIQNLETHPTDIVSFAAETHKISRQAVSIYLRKLITDEIIEKNGDRKSTIYKLKTQKHVFSFERTPGLAEDVIFHNNIKPVLPKNLAENVIQICNFAFSEIFNNAVDHSEAHKISVTVELDILRVRIYITDDGVGIFNKIQKALNLENPRFAILELVKGKFTTAPQRHSGEGIFFTSRMVDRFLIISSNLTFYGHKNSDIILESPGKDIGTIVVMEINRNSLIRAADVYDEYAAGDKDDYAFSKTIVPVGLMQYEGEALISRSQAKRLIARFERFKEVALDFTGVKLIGQAFADEVFRVFKNDHPNVNLIPINAADEVKKMIAHVTAKS